MWNIPSHERKGLSLVNMLGLSLSIHTAHRARYWKFLFHKIYKSFISPVFARQIMPVLFILCYNGSLVTWTVVSLTASKCKPLTFSVFGFSLSYAANMFIIVLLYNWLVSSLYSTGTDRIGNTASNRSIVAGVSVAANTCLSSRYQTMVVFVSHVTTSYLLDMFIVKCRMLYRFSDHEKFEAEWLLTSLGRQVTNHRREQTNSIKKTIVDSHTINRSTLSLLSLFPLVFTW
jgi:hypothetical protein